jgi:hypothetical protein
MKLSIQTASILDIEIDTNGLKGGDSGHGGYLNIRLISTDQMKINRDTNYVLDLTVMGDSEMTNLAVAFKKISEHLIEKYKINDLDYCVEVES